MHFSYRRGGVTRGAEVRFSAPVKLVEDLATFETIVPARGEWRTCVEVAPVIDGVGINPRYRCGQPVERAEPAERLARWRRQVPQVDTDHPGLKNVVARSAEDLGALRIFDPDFPERMVVAAGAPWIPTWPSACCRPWPGSRGTKSIPGTTNSPVGSSTRCGSAMPPRCRSGEGASTTAPPMPPLCS
jgi:hypothetical protein